jgi:hypothetical protein
MPADDVERALLATSQAGDVGDVMAIVATTPLYLPSVGITGENGQRLFTKNRDGVPYVLAFTSVPTMQRVVGHDGWRATSLAELVRAWPTPAWGLAINPGTPIVVVVAPPEVPDLLPAVDGFQPENDAERLLRDALAVPDGAVLLDVLATSRVHLPTKAVNIDGEWVVPVFTSQRRCTEFLNAFSLTVGMREMYLVEVFSRWPGPEYRLAVNLGSAMGFSLPGTMVPGLFAHAMDLAQQLADGTQRRR